MFLHSVNDSDLFYFYLFCSIMSCYLLHIQFIFLFYCVQTVDQFFGLKVPMRFTELNSLFRGIDNALQVYANLVVDDLGE